MEQHMFMTLGVPRGLPALLQLYHFLPCYENKLFRELLGIVFKYSFSVFFLHLDRNSFPEKSQ